jgi:hypothetical protein
MTDQITHPQFQVNQQVRLVVDEGLDTPENLQGHEGVIIDTFGPNEFSSYQSYFVLVGQMVVYCEHYHLEPLTVEA